MNKRLARAVKNALTVIKYTVWVAAAFIASLFLAQGLAYLLVSYTSIEISQNMLNISAGVVSYGIMLAGLILVPKWLAGAKTTKKEIGLTRLLKWSEIGWSVVGFLVYFALLLVLFWLAETFLPGFNLQEEQQLGIQSPRYGLEMTMAFLLLVVIGPIIEEVVFRGYLYGKLRARGVSTVSSILVTSVLFGMAHVQLNVAIDTFALSVIMCLSREFTGSLWVSILMHMIKNGIAFMVGFVLVF